MFKKIFLSLFGVLIFAAVALFMPEVNYVLEPLSLPEAKSALNKVMSDDGEWNGEKITQTEQVIKKLPHDQSFYLATQLHVIKQETYAPQIKKLNQELNTDNVGANFEQLFKYGVIPPLDKSDVVHRNVRPEITRFVQAQPNHDQLMPVAVAAQGVLNQQGWQPALTALKSCKEWQCKVVLDMTFNTKERLITSIREMKAGVYE